MIDFLRRLFSRPPDLSEASREFIEDLASSRIWILAIGIRGTPAIPRFADSEAIAMVAAHRKELSELDDDDSVFPFNFEAEGRQVMPFFSSEALAKQFLEHGELGDVSLFQPCRLLAGFVAVRENEVFYLVLDPGSASEHRITDGERWHLRSLSGSPG